MSVLEIILYIALGLITIGWVTIVIVKAIKKKKDKNEEDED